MFVFVLSSVVTGNLMWSWDAGSDAWFPVVRPQRYLCLVLSSGSHSSC